MSAPYPNSGSWRRPTRAWLEAHNAMRARYPELYPPAEEYLAEFGLTLKDVVETAEEPSSHESRRP